MRGPESPTRRATRHGRRDDRKSESRRGIEPRRFLSAHRRPSRRVVETLGRRRLVFGRAVSEGPATPFADDAAPLRGAPLVEAMTFAVGDTTDVVIAGAAGTAGATMVPLIFSPRRFPLFPEHFRVASESS